MKVGDKVRVKESATIYVEYTAPGVPQSTYAGKVGEVTEILDDEWLPYRYKVAFNEEQKAWGGGKFGEHELELCGC